jgi:hypothetical protein
MSLAERPWSIILPKSTLSLQTSTATTAHHHQANRDQTQHEGTAVTIGRTSTTCGGNELSLGTIGWQVVWIVAAATAANFARRTVDA